MLEAGTNIVGGVNARKAGTHASSSTAQELPVFGTVAEAMAETGADVSVVFVPPAFTKDACIEAIDAEIALLVVITEGVPGAGHRRGRGPTSRASQHPDHRPELPRHHHARASRWPASRRTPSPARARSAWCRSRAR